MADANRIDEIRGLLALGRFEFTRHAFRRAVERNISEMEIRQAGGHAEVVEEYPDDKYAPSCLVLGYTHAKRPLHLQVTVQESGLVKIITLYEPSDADWYGNCSRRK
jgi:hypothetical protein